MEIFGILVLFAAKKGITSKPYEGTPLRTADKVYLIFLYLGYLLCMAATVLSFPEYAVGTPRILVVSAGMAFAICVVDLLSDLIGLGMGAKEAGKHCLSHSSDPPGYLPDRPTAGPILVRQPVHRHDHREGCVCRLCRIGSGNDLREGFLSAEKTGLIAKAGVPNCGSSSYFVKNIKSTECI